MEVVSNNILFPEHVSTNTFLSLNFNFEVRKVYSFQECITVNLVFVKTFTSVVIVKVCLELLLKELEVQNVLELSHCGLFIRFLD